MRKLFTVIFFLSTIAIYAQQPPVPKLWTRVTDEAGVLSPEFTQRLEGALKAFEDTTSNQIAVLLIPTLGGAIMEEYTIKVVEEWKLGRADFDNGALLFVAVKDRKLRIEVGHGLEGVLTDVVSSQIIRHEITPHFRQSDYEGGIAAGVLAMTQAIGGEYKGTPVREKPSGRGGSVVTTIIIITLIILISRNNRGNRRNNRGGGWFFGPMWYGGSAWSGRSGSGGGFGGFSGGGGSFGGGGASGSW